MRYFTKEWYKDGIGSNIYMIIEISEAAEIYSEEYFQQLYADKLNEYLQLQKDMSKVTIDDIFPVDAWSSFCFVNENGEFVDASQTLPSDEFVKIREDLRRKNQEARDNFVPFQYDEELSTKQFYENMYLGGLNCQKANLPKDILKDVADLRVLALNKASAAIHKRISDFCISKEERSYEISQAYQDYAKTITPQLPEKIQKNYGYHDCKVTHFELQGEVAILKLDSRGGYSNVSEVIFHNVTLLEQENIINSIWIYDEIHLTDGRYEFHTMLQDEKGELHYLTLSASDVDFKVY